MAGVKRKAVLITNEKSGTHLAGTEEPESVARWLGEADLEVEVLKGDVGSQIRASQEREADIVVVDGGDGTISAVIEAHVETGRPIGIVPGGTMNLLATDYGVPLEREVAAKVIGTGTVRSFDAARLGEHVFLHTAFTGLPARIGVHRENLRGRLGLTDRLRLALHAIATVRRDQRLTMKGELQGGGEINLTSGTFAFVVGAVRGAMLPRPHREIVEAGALTAFSVEAGGGLDLARLVLRGAFGDLAADPTVTRASMSHGRLTGRRRTVHAMLDGESVHLALPAELKLLPGAVNIIVPPAAGEPHVEKEEVGHPI